MRFRPVIPSWAAAAAVLGGVAWIPVRLGVSVAFSTDFLRLSYVTWNLLMVVPLALMLVAAVGLRREAESRGARVGAGLAAAGLVGMLAGVIVEFAVFGGLSGNRDGAVLGWMLYLLGGLLPHVIGLAILAISRWRTSLGAMALAIALLHLAWLPAGMVGGDAVLVADQVAIGLAWVAIGVLASR